MAQEAVVKDKAKHEKTVGRVNVKYLVHCLIGLVLMFGFRYLEPIDTITPMGMKVLGIFLGMIYLWSTVDTVWPSFLGLVAVALTGFMPMNQAFAESFGSSQVVLSVGILALVGAVNAEGICHYIGRWFVTRKIINGRPWMFTFMIFAGVYILTILTSTDTAIFLFWPILYGLFKEIGYKPGDKYATLMIIGVLLVGLFGFAAMPFRGIVLLMLTNFESMSGVAINPLSYLGMSIILGPVLIAGLVMMFKYVFRPDVTLLKAVHTDMFEKNALPPMNLRQKMMVGALLVFMAGMFLPSFLPAGSWLKNTLAVLGASGFTTLLVAVLAVIHVEGKPLLPFGPIMNKVMNWPMVSIIGSALVIGSTLTSPETGIRDFLTNIFSGIVEGKSPVMVMVIFVIIAIIATNFSNNYVIGVILLTIASTLAATMGFNPIPVAMMIIFTVHIASVTPAACPYAAILHSNKEWVKTNEIYRYTVAMSVYVLAVLLVLGIPLANMIAQ